MNYYTRKVLSIILATTKELLDLFPLTKIINNKIKARIDSKDINPFITLRLLNKPPINTREPRTVMNLGLNVNEWDKGKYFIEEHKAGHLHHDLSIIVNNKVYRLARTPSIENKKKGFIGLFPGPNERTSWILQPEHYIKEVPNLPVITDGYGKGTTKIIKSGKCYASLSKNGIMHVMFEDIDGVYAVIEKDNRAMFVRKSNIGPGLGKHKLTDSKDVIKYVKDPRYWFFVKKDGAAVEWEIVSNNDGDKYLRIYSWRPDAKTEKKYGVQKQIEHTYKLPICDKELPSYIMEASGRGELWIEGKDGLLKLSSFLNSLDTKSRTTGYNPHLYIHDVHTWNGVNISNVPYIEKLTLMEQLHLVDKRFKLIKHASTEQGKIALYEKGKKEPGVDGVVAWNVNAINEPGTKIKYKHNEDNWYPATIVDIIPQRGEKGNEFGYPVLENEWGTRFVSSGLGLNESIRRDMIENQDKWIGTSVRYSAERHFPGTHKPFQPIIKAFKE